MLDLNWVHLATNKPSRDARRHHALEYPAQDVALAKTFVPCTAEHRMVGDTVLDAELAEPAIGKVHLHLGADTPLRPDRKYIQADGLVIGVNAFFFSRRDQLVGLATRYSVPTVYPWREAVVAGGLMSYGATNTELVINLKTAKALGVDVPPKLLVFADEVIE